MVLGSMVQLTRRQRQALAVLAAANLIALLAVGLFVLHGKSGSNHDMPTSPLNPQQMESCHQAVSRSLFDANHSALVHTQDDGTIRIELQRTTTTDTVRLDADAATWAVLEAVGSRTDCRGLVAVQVNVVLKPALQNASTSSTLCRGQSINPGLALGTCREVRATSRVGMRDLLMWSFGAIDDAELAQRVDYRVMALPPPVTSDATAVP
jgi:hypothetical protein